MINERLRDYRRDALRSGFLSAFWSVIQHRRARRRFTFQEIATNLGVDKSNVSRWFSRDLPNWEIETVADLAGAMNVSVNITITDNETGEMFGPSGLMKTKSPNNLIDAGVLTTTTNS